MKIKNDLETQLRNFQVETNPKPAFSAFNVVKAELILEMGVGNPMEARKTDRSKCESERCSFQLERFLSHTLYGAIVRSSL